MTAPPHTQYVSFSADVNPFTAQALIALCAQIAREGTKELYLLLSTPGGQVREGIQIYNILRGMPFKLTTHNVGNVDSIGNVIFLAGSERYACSNATFMFHGVGFNVNGQQRFEQKDLKERLEGIEQDNHRIAQIIEHRAKFSSRAVIDDLFLQASTKDVSYAKGHGLIDDIREVQIPAGCPVHQLVFQR